MFSNKLAFTALAAVCVMAASAGGYFALRQNAATTLPGPSVAAGSTSEPTQSASSAGPAQSPSSGPTESASSRTTRSVVSDRPVQETESIVSLKASAANSRAAKTPAKTTTGTPTAKPAQVLASGSNTPAPFDRTWPSSAASTSAPAQAQQGTLESAAPQLRPGDTVVVTQEPAPPLEPPQKSYEELVVSADSVIGLQSETTVSSERARVEDRVEARVTRDVRVGNRVAIPAGSRAIGVVTQVERGGKFKEHAKLAIRFQTVVLTDGTRLPISTEAVIRDGSAPSDESAKKIGGGAVAGTILGAILGGAKGAAIGGMAGAGAGAGAVAAGDRSAATLHAGEPITIRLLSPVTVTSER
jgi:hypothetical protein